MSKLRCKHCGKELVKSVSWTNLWDKTDKGTHIHIHYTGRRGSHYCTDDTDTIIGVPRLGKPHYFKEYFNQIQNADNATKCS